MPSHLDIVQSLLQPLDFTVVHRTRRRERARSRSASTSPDLAMVDVSMPGMTGWQVAETLRTMPGLPSLKIVIVSANAHEFSTGRHGCESRRLSHQAHRHAAHARMPRRAAEPAVELRSQFSPPHRESDLQGALPDHSRHHVDDLYQLGLIGHVRGIQAKLREIETDPTTNPSPTRMRTLVANFDLKRYMNVLEGMRKHG